MEKKKQQVWEDITIEEVKNNIQKTTNWREPSIDKVDNFWIINFTLLHEPNQSNQSVLLNLELCPTWLTTGKTLLIPKSEETNKIIDQLLVFPRFIK